MNFSLGLTRGTSISAGLVPPTAGSGWHDVVSIPCWYHARANASLPVLPEVRRPRGNHLDVTAWSFHALRGRAERWLYRGKRLDPGGMPEKILKAGKMETYIEYFYFSLWQHTIPEIGSSSSALYCRTAPSPLQDFLFIRGWALPQVFWHISGHPWYILYCIISQLYITRCGDYIEG